MARSRAAREQGGLSLARRIQQAILASTGLSCSIGVAPNKLLAKLASEMDKPNGVTILSGADLAERVWPLPCRKINGVGPKASARLEQLGIRTIGELSRCEPAWLIEQFGRHYGQWLHEVSWGRDERELVIDSEPVSMSCETTFERDLHAVRDRPELSAVFTSLCERLAADLARHGYAGRTIGVKLRYDNFQSVTRAQTLEYHTADADGDPAHGRPVPEACAAGAAPAPAGRARRRPGARGRGPVAAGAWKSWSCSEARRGPDPLSWPR